jgi:hypothetical protein
MLPFEVEATPVHDVDVQQSIPLTEVVPGTVKTAVGPDAMAPMTCERPAPRQPDFRQETDEKVDILVTVWAGPTSPFSTSTATP